MLSDLRKTYTVRKMEDSRLKGGEGGEKNHCSITSGI